MRKSWEFELNQNKGVIRVKRVLELDKARDISDLEFTFDGTSFPPLVVTVSPYDWKAWKEFFMQMRLIEHAHELLEALEELVHLKDELKHTDQAEYERRKPLAWEAARKAIAKVRGEVRQ
jgi:hypothetical protein